MRDDRSVHTYPVWEEHDTGSVGGCWCIPEVYILCPGCGGDDHGCPMCDASRFRGQILAPLPLEPDRTYLVVHHATMPAGQGEG